MKYPRDYTERKPGVEKLLWELCFLRLPKINIKDFIEDLQVRKVGINAHSLIKKAISNKKCLKSFSFGRETKSHIKYCKSIIRLLQSFGVEVIVVFHRGKLDLQKEYEDNQSKLRHHYKLVAKRAKMQHYIKKALDITELELEPQLLQKLKKWKVEFIIAPYDANAQLTFLAKCGTVQVVISEDPHLIPFACPRVIYKMDEHGNGLDFQLCKLYEYKLERYSFIGLDEDDMRELCVFSSCKYFWVESNMPSAFLMFNLHLSFEEVFENCSKSFAEEYNPKSFFEAVDAFKYHIVYDPETQKMVYLSELPARLIGNCGFLGSIKGPDTANKIVIGEVDPLTLDPLTYNEENAESKRRRIFAKDDIDAELDKKYDFSKIGVDLQYKVSDVSSEDEDDRCFYHEDSD